MIRVASFLQTLWDVHAAVSFADFVLRSSCSCLSRSHELLEYVSRHADSDTVRMRERGDAEKSRAKLVEGRETSSYRNKANRVVPTSLLALGLKAT